MSSNKRQTRGKKENEEKPPVSSISANTKPQPSGPVRNADVEHERVEYMKLLAQEQQLVKQILLDKTTEQEQFKKDKEQFFAKFEEEKKQLLCQVDEQKKQRLDELETTTTTVTHYRSLLESEQQTTKMFKAQIRQLEQELVAANALIAKSKASMENTIDEFKKKMQDLTIEHDYIANRGKQREDAFNQERENHRALQQNIKKIKQAHDERVEELEAIIQQKQLAISQLEKLAANTKNKWQEEVQNTFTLQIATDKAAQTQSSNEEAKSKEIAKLSFLLAESQARYLQVQHEMHQAALELKKKTQENYDLSAKYHGLCEKEQTVQSDLHSAKQTIALVQDQLDNVASEKMQQQEQTIANLEHSNKQLNQELHESKQSHHQYQQELFKYKQLFEDQKRQTFALQEQVNKHQNRVNYSAASGWALKIVEKMGHSVDPFQKDTRAIVQSCFHILAAQFNDLINLLHEKKQLAKTKQEARNQMHTVLLYDMCKSVQEKQPLNLQIIQDLLVTTLSNNVEVTANDKTTIGKLCDLIQASHSMAECMNKFCLEYNPSEDKQNVAFDKTKHAVMEKTQTTTTTKKVSKPCSASGIIKHVVMPGIIGNNEILVKAVVILRKVNEFV